jgi:hypothetical protein
VQVKAPFIVLELGVYCAVRIVGKCEKYWKYDGWRVVDDDDYGQAVGNPKRKV